MPGHKATLSKQRRITYETHLRRKLLVVIKWNIFDYNKNSMWNIKYSWNLRLKISTTRILVKMFEQNCRHVLDVILNNASQSKSHLWCGVNTLVLLYYTDYAFEGWSIFKIHDFWLSNIYCLFFQNYYSHLVSYVEVQRILIFE